MSETKSDEQKRIDSFMEEYKALVSKHNVDFANFPMFVPDESGKGSFKVICQSVPVDLVSRSVKSPFIPQ